MAFVKIDKSRRFIGDEPCVSMAAYLADGKVHRSKSVAFRISYTLMVELNWINAPETASVHVVVHEGIGDDVGFLQITREPQGYKATIRGTDKQGAAISVALERFKHYILNECPVSSQPVTHVVDGNTLVIQCPDWLRFNPESVPTPVPKSLAERRVVHQMERRTKR